MVEIANNFTNIDWENLEKELKDDFTNVDLWNKAFDIFESRLNERYIHPVEQIQNNSSVIGEGFSITAILCSLIESLETFYQGKCYKYEKPRTNTEYGNGNSGVLFTNFLTSKEPFKSSFNRDLAEDFYKNVRCALLHEAMTRNGWKIRIDTDKLVEENNGEKILNRFYFLCALKDYIQTYKTETLESEERKKAFIRKMSCICKNV